MTSLKINIPNNNDQMFIFNSELLNIKGFNDCKTSFTNNETYSGKTFMSQTCNKYYKVLHRRPRETDLYQIPNREQFIDSLSTMTANSFVVKINFCDMSMIYVDLDNSLCVNKINTICCDKSEYMDHEFIPLPDKINTV